MATRSGDPRVGIVILNWNGRDDTIACLKSLERLDYPSYEIVVVDNGSIDASPALIREQFPLVTLIENGENLGFAAGSNVGISRVMQNCDDYVLLLNNDTEVGPDMLRILVEVAEATPDVGVLGPTIYYYDRADVIWSAGGIVGPRGEARHRRVDELDDGSREAVRDVDYVTGCAMLVKRSVIEKIGMLDERFFAYFEETEWCCRARKAGFRVVYVPRARMWHKIQPAARASSPFYLYLMARNRLLYLKCSGADLAVVFAATLDVLRTALSWALRSKHREMRPYSIALVRGVADFVVGRFGAPPVRW